MKQLVEIEAIYLKKEDFIFDFKNRNLTKIDYVHIERESINGHRDLGEPYNVHVSYGVDCDYSDNFKPNEKVLILIDTDNILKKVNK